MKLDFSMFHDLMHWPFTRHCSEMYPHGWLRAGFYHLKLTWQERRWDQVRAPWHTLLLCKLGRHEVQVWYSRDGVGAWCTFCDFEREPTLAERTNIPKDLTDFLGD